MRTSLREYVYGGASALSFLIILLALFAGLPKAYDVDARLFYLFGFGMVSVGWLTGHFTWTVTRDETRKKVIQKLYDNSIWAKQIYYEGFALQRMREEGLEPRPWDEWFKQYLKDLDAKFPGLEPLSK